MAFRLFCFSCIILISCSKPIAKQDIAFYYWKSNFKVNRGELSVLSDNNCKTLYLKYFDVVKEDGNTRPAAIISFESPAPKQRIVPVVFIKNVVFTGIDSLQTENLARKTISLIEQINFSNSISVDEIQWDCDWTEKTRTNYFCFLRRVKAILKSKISATIRLHQIKYRYVTGIPPVDKGVLMYYNMSDITSEDKNSIYDKTTANKYLSSLRSYPLHVDIALPIFAWGIQSRNDKVISLLNKVNENDFVNDTHFVFVNPAYISVKHACFKTGYYFQEGDKVRIEYIKQEELLEMAEDIKSNLSTWPSETIFYDLDSLNLNRYDKSIFKKVLDMFQ